MEQYRQRVFLHLAYRGTAYHGWQTQANGLPTVQSSLEAALAKMLGYLVHVHGCGRTDAGVHAEAYVAHFDLEAPLLTQQPVRDLNRRLPPDIRVYGWVEMSAGAHAQRDARWRAYEYRIGFDCVDLKVRQNPFRQGLIGRYDQLELDVPLMQTVAERYAAADDFRAFCRRPDQYPHTRCRIDYCRLLLAESGGLGLFQIQADRFLQNMVRLLVARMIDVGAGRIPLEEVQAALDGGRPLKAQRPAYADGLFLVGVGY